MTPRAGLDAHTHTHTQTTIKCMLDHYSMEKEVKYSLI